MASTFMILNDENGVTWRVRIVVRFDSCRSAVESREEHKSHSVAFVYLGLVLECCFTIVTADLVNAATLVGYERCSTEGF